MLGSKKNKKVPPEMGPGPGNSSGGHGEMVVHSPVTQGISEAQLQAIESRLRNEFGSGGGGEKSGGYEMVGDIPVPNKYRADPSYDHGELEAKRNLIPTLEASVMINFITDRMLNGALYGFVSAFILHWSWKFATRDFAAGVIWYQAGATALFTMLAVIGLLVGIPMFVSGMRYLEVWNSRQSLKPREKVWLITVGALTTTMMLLILVLTLLTLA